MKLEPFAPRSAALLACLLLLLVTLTPRADAQSAAATPAYGPYNVHSIAGGIGVTKQLAPHDPLALSGSGWSLTLWVRPDTASQTTLLAGVGQPLETFPRFLGLRDGKPIFWAGDEHILETSTPLAPNTWHSLAVFADGAGHPPARRRRGRRTCLTPHRPFHTRTSDRADSYTHLRLPSLQRPARARQLSARSLA